jgi:hypothetical protein
MTLPSRAGDPPIPPAPTAGGKTMIEEQIRAATRDRADEITPDRIRPLVLTRPVPVSSQDRGGRRRRWIAPIAAAAAVALIAAVVASVGAGHRGRASGSAPSSGGRPHRTHPAGPTGRAAARLDNEVLGLFVPATGPQYTAGMQLEGTIQALTVTGTDRCLARHGVTIPVPPVASMAARYADNYVDNSQFPGLARISRTHVFVTATYLFQFRPAAGQRQAFHRWFGSCQHSATARFAPLMSAGQQLNDRTWGTLMNRAQTAPPVRATLSALRACATRYGWPSNPYGPPAGAIRSFSDFANWVFGHLDGAGSRGASAATMRRLDRHWSVIFVRCGRPTLAAQDRWLAAAQIGFVRQHQRQVRAAEALARRALAQGQASP